MKIGRLLIIAFVMLSIACVLSPPVHAQPLKQGAWDIGQEGWVDGPAFGAAANWDDCDTGQTVWQLAPGFVLVQYENAISSKYGKTSINTSYLQPSGYYKVSMQQLSDFDRAVDAAIKIGDYEFAGKLQNRKKQYTDAQSQAYSNYAAIQVDVQACGNGNFVDRKGASIQGKLRLRVMFVGRPEDVKNEVNQALALIEKQTQLIPGPNKYIVNGREGLCLYTDDYQFPGNVRVVACDKGGRTGRQWTYDPVNKYIVNVREGLCLYTDNHQFPGNVRVVACDKGGRTGRQWNPS